MFKLLLAWHSASHPSQVHYSNNQQEGKHKTIYNMFFQQYCREVRNGSTAQYTLYINQYKLL